MNAEEIKAILRQGVVSFTYEKKDGTVREARGTLNMEVIEEACAKPKGGDNPSKAAGYVPYFDVDKDSWRCFNPDTFKLVEGSNNEAAAEAQC